MSSPPKVPLPLIDFDFKAAALSVAMGLYQYSGTQPKSYEEIKSLMGLPDSILAHEIQLGLNLGYFYVTDDGLYHPNPRYTERDNYREYFHIHGGTGPSGSQQRRSKRRRTKQ